MFNWGIFILLIIITIILAFTIYKKEKNYTAVSIAVLGVIASTLAGFLTTPILVPSQILPTSIENTVKDSSTIKEIDQLNPIIKINPDFPKVNEIVTISIEVPIKSKGYDIYINFANEKGEFNKDNSSLRLKTDYINEKWILYKKLTEHTCFRVEIEKGYDTIYKSEIYNINVSKSDLIPYNITKELKEGTTYINEHTNFSISLPYIGYTSSTAVITYPDGKIVKEDCKTGQSWSYTYNGINYRVTLLSANFDTKLFSINIREIVK